MNFPRKKVLINVIFICFGLISCLFLSNYRIKCESVIIHSVRQINTSIFVINGFSDFLVLYDDPDIYSKKTSQYINFSYDTNGIEDPDMHIDEYYHLSFNSSKKDMDFNVSVKVNYFYAGGAFGQAKLGIGSNFYENGSYYGLPKPNDKNYIVYSNIRDPWNDNNGGVYEIVGFPNDTNDKYDISYKAPSKYETIRFTISRISNKLTCEIFDENMTSLIIHNWNSGISRCVNWIWLGVYIYPTTAKSVRINLTDISGFIILDDETSTTSALEDVSSTTSALEDVSTTITELSITPIITTGFIWTYPVLILVCLGITLHYFQNNRKNVRK